MLNKLYRYTKNTTLNPFQCLYPKVSHRTLRNPKEINLSGSCNTYSGVRKVTEWTECTGIMIWGNPAWWPLCMVGHLWGKRGSDFVNPCEPLHHCWAGGPSVGVERAGCNLLRWAIAGLHSFSDCCKAVNDNVLTTERSLPENQTFPSAKGFGWDLTRLALPPTYIRGKGFDGGII